MHSGLSKITTRLSEIWSAVKRSMASRLLPLMTTANNTKMNKPSFRLDPDLRAIGKHEIGRMTKVIRDFYLSTDNPPPDNIVVFPPTLATVIGDKGLYSATVRIETRFISFSPKSHKVTIRFRLNKYGKLDPATIQYV